MAFFTADSGEPAVIKRKTGSFQINFEIRDWKFCTSNLKFLQFNLIVEPCQGSIRSTDVPSLPEPWFEIERHMQFEMVFRGPMALKGRLVTFESMGKLVVPIAKWL